MIWLALAGAVLLGLAFGRPTVVRDLGGFDVRSPKYLGLVARWEREQRRDAL